LFFIYFLCGVELIKINQFSLVKPISNSNALALTQIKQASFTDRWVAIKNVHSGRCLKSNVKDSLIVQWDCDSTDQYSWKFTHNSDDDTYLV